MFRFAYRFVFLWIICISIAACQPPATTGAGASATSVVIPVQNTPTVSVSTAQEATMIPIQTPPGSAQQAMVDLAVAQLAKTLGVDPGQISVVEVKPVIWRDASLGCPKPGIDYIQVETPGFNIQLKAGEQVYRYHSNETGRVIHCEK